MNKILFINTLHNSLDDRTFYHHANALSVLNTDIYIFSSLENRIDKLNNIHLCAEKIYNKDIVNQAFYIKKLIENIQPNIVICDSPIGILAASLAKKSKTVIYDVTEWIPSKEHLKNTKKLFLPFKFIGLLFLNLFAGLLTDKFIFGEYHKSKLFKPIFWKKRIISSYYPDLKYFNPKPPQVISEKMRLYYSGWFTFDKGFDKVLELTELIAKANTNKKIELQITGSYNSETDKINFDSIINSLPENVSVFRSDFLGFNDFCNELNKPDIFLDLRKIDLENTHCLPIKLFYYLSNGRPVVYSGLKAIENTMTLADVGVAFENNDIEAVVKKISDYFQDTSLYLKQCENAKKLSEEKFNWKIIKTEFTDFVLLN